MIAIKVLVYDSCVNLFHDYNRLKNTTEFLETFHGWYFLEEKSLG
jgi:hypothetical protein